MTIDNVAVLKKNVRALMKEKDMTQKQLADEIGMTQSNLSKCLNTDEPSHIFTLEQVCSIADCFEKSIDELVGREQGSRDITPVLLGGLFESLISKYQIRYFDYKVNETVKHPEFENIKDKHISVSYNAFYFPNYINPSAYIGLDDEESYELYAEIQACGNDLPQNIKVNDFIKKYIDAFEKHEEGTYNDETFNILVEAYRKALSK